MTKRAFGHVAPLPNAGSAHQTPASLMSDIHYANLRLLERWTWERYARFCQFLRMTPYEVASLVTMRHEAVEKFRASNRIPGHNARAIALLLTLFEAWACKEWSGDVIENVFPNLTKTPPSAATSSPAGATPNHG